MREMRIINYNNKTMISVVINGTCSTINNTKNYSSLCLAQSAVLFILKENCCCFYAFIFFVCSFAFYHYGEIGVGKTE